MLHQCSSAEPLLFKVILINLDVMQRDTLTLGRLAALYWSGEYVSMFSPRVFFGFSFPSMRLFYRLDLLFLLYYVWNVFTKGFGFSPIFMFVYNVKSACYLKDFPWCKNPCFVSLRRGLVVVSWPLGSFVLFVLCNPAVWQVFAARMSWA